MDLRNPFRASIDPVTGDPFIGDVGETDRLSGKVWSVPASSLVPGATLQPP